MIDLSDVLNDPDLCSPFTIIRTVGKFGPGGWQTVSTAVIPAFGAARNATPKQLEMLPEADRVSDAVTFRSTTRMNITMNDKQSKSDGQTSDLIVYRGENYRVIAIKDYSEQGYWWSMAARMAGN